MREIMHLEAEANNSHYINGQYMDNDEMCNYYKSLDIWDKK